MGCQSLKIALFPVKFPVCREFTRRQVRSALRRQGGSLVRTATFPFSGRDEIDVVEDRRASTSTGPSPTLWKIVDTRRNLPGRPKSSLRLFDRISRKMRVRRSLIVSPRRAWRRAIRARLEKLEGSAPAEMSRCGEIVRLGAADREQSQACGSLLPVYYQSRETEVCLFSSEAAHHRT